MGPLETTRLAARNLVRNRRRSLLAGATVIVGVAAILFCKAYVDGLERLILDFVIDAREGAMQVQRTGYGASRDLAPLSLDLPATGELAARIAAAPGVSAAAPRLRFVGLLSNGAATTGLAGLGVDPAAEAAVCPRGPGARGGPVDGPGLTAADADEVVIGQGLADSLHLRVGSSVTLMAQTRGGSLDTADVVVAGVYHFPDPIEDKHLAVIPLAVAQRLVHMEGRATTFAVATRARGTAAIDAAATALRAALVGVEPAVELHPWHELSPYLRDVMSMEGELMGVIVIVVFMLVVAGIVNTVLMSVLERTREIGTLMALGLRRRGVLRLFVSESLLLAVAAALVGVAAGAALVALLGKDGLAFDLPGAGIVRVFPRFAPRYIAWALLAAIGGGVLGGLVPARRAARLRPVEALRS